MSADEPRGRSRASNVVVLCMVALCGLLAVTGVAGAERPLMTDAQRVVPAVAPTRPRAHASTHRKRAGAHHSSKRPRHSARHRGNGDAAVVCKHKKRCPKTSVSHPVSPATPSPKGSPGSSASPGQTPSSSQGSPSSQDSSPSQGQSPPTKIPSPEAPAGESTAKTPSPEDPSGGPPPKTPPLEDPSSETPAQAPSAPSEPLRLFSATSVFNQELPTTAPLAGNSAQLVSAFESQIGKYEGHVVINTTQWSAPVYVVGADAATVALAGESAICPRPEGAFSGFLAQVEAVPLPANAIPAAGTDKEVIVWQPSTGHLWELWRVLEEDGHWTACWGGEIADAYTSNGIYPAPFGAGASGLSLLGGQIHLEDLEHGAINHALEVLIPDTQGPGFVWPADRTDGASKDTDAIPEGTRFRLRPSLSLGSLHLSPAALEIATAIQHYGMIVGDTGGAVTLQAQDPTPLIAEGKANPYDKLLPNPYEALNAIPWSQLEVVSPSYKGGADASSSRLRARRRLRRASSSSRPRAKRRLRRAS
jgi:hypothetical protein